MGEEILRKPRGAFVARYACDGPFRSFLRRMRRRQSSSGGAVSKDAAGRADQLRADYETAKALVASKEDTRDVEDLLDEIGPELPGD
jgi:hypothetical protein